MTRTLVTLSVAIAALTPLTVEAAPIFIDFATGTGNTPAAPTNFNRVVDATSVTNLIDIDGDATAVDITVNNVPSGSNSGRTPAANTDAAIFGSALVNHIASNTVAIQVTFSDLIPGLAYDFVGSASRGNLATDGSQRAIGTYTFTGAGTPTSVDFEPVNNNSQVFRADDVFANASGEIALTVTRHANNNYNFVFLNALSIEAVAVPEPASMSLLALGGVALLGRRKRAC
ncbi:MAG TPA: PEP-CTERM sorting domain-containing protein [Tepidisphaeraceae bacterium]|nr:PEP-CTERM sorting domain-containing protein [Tepidisphaeraceae bacterium]